MPRPSLKKERRAAILQAFGECVARYGVEGATLERTAEAANLARALIRHNVGNKDALLDAFIARFLAQATAGVDELFDALPKRHRIDALIDYLFDPEYVDDTEVRVTNALTMAAADRPALARQLMAWTSDFTRRVAAELESAFADATPDDIDAVATGIVAIYYNVDTMAPLENAKHLRDASVRAAQLLVRSLGQERIKTS
ncbi:MAG: hypothetical protein AAFQ62_15410 [Pseudomonadota bacterium]